MREKLLIEFSKILDAMDKKMINELCKILEIEKVDKRISITTTENHSIVLNDVVKQPSHYIGEQGLEVEEVLRNFIPRYENAYVAHRVGSAIEYLLRSPLKNGKQDLEKARYNLDQAINHIEGENNEDKPIQGRNE